MKPIGLGWVVTGTLCLVGCAASGPALRSDPAEASSRIKAGSSTAVQVKTLLGNPWRTTNYGETYCGCPHGDFQEVWEYRGADSTGPYKLHIEFDERGIARILVKTSNVTGTARVLASSTADPTPHHGHHTHGEHHEGAHADEGPAPRANLEPVHAEHGAPAEPTAQP
jgi:hypothetical protein